MVHLLLLPLMLCHSRQEMAGSPSSRLLHMLLYSTISTAVSTLEIAIATWTSPGSSMLSSRTIMESALMPSTLLTWMLTRSLETLIPLLQSPPPVLCCPIYSPPETEEDDQHMQVVVVSMAGLVQIFQPTNRPGGES